METLTYLPEKHELFGRMMRMRAFFMQKNSPPASLHEFTKHNHLIDGWYTVGYVREVSDENYNGVGFFDIYLPTNNRVELINTMLRDVCSELSIPYFDRIAANHLEPSVSSREEGGSGH